MALNRKYNQISSSNKALLLIFLFIFTFFPQITENNSEDSVSFPETSSISDECPGSILWDFMQGAPGQGPTMQPKVLNFSETGPSFIVVGTDAGLMIIDLNGTVKASLSTFTPVIGIELVDDISGDSQKDLIIITLDQGYANVFAVSSNNCTILWRYQPIITGFNQNTFLSQNYTTKTWDVKVINDINGDSFRDVVISSWFRLFALNGKTGNEIWRNEVDCGDDIWYIEIMEDINENGFNEIIVGTEDGEVIAIDSVNGHEIWYYQIPISEFPGRHSTLYYQESIADIKIVSDFSQDQVSDILVAGDDGILRFLSGKDKSVLGYGQLYNPISYTNVFSVDDVTYYSYDYRERLFTLSGSKIIEIPDVNDDGINEYLAITWDLVGDPYTYEDEIKLRFFNITT
ncbi:MAG: hypothetical protein ACTSWY_07880, partial [Promethearchaeota archaeon]